MAGGATLAPMPVSEPSCPLLFVQARRALDAALASSSQRRVRTKPLHGKWSLLDSPPPPADAAKAMLVRQRASAGFERLLPARRRLPAFSCAAQLQAAVATSQLTLVLGATGCGKSTQLPQLLMEAAIEAGLPCRIIATQPRRISAAAVAQAPTPLCRPPLPPCARQLLRCSLQ
eukprot:6212280-Pleurochrysis_carterae.AAC.2